MATTSKGIYYPDNYDEVADILSDMKKMAESLENADFLQTLYRLKGTVDKVEDLKLKTNMNISDTYKCFEDNNNYTWNGTDWVNIGQNIDLSNYYDKNYIDTKNIETNKQLTINRALITTTEEIADNTDYTIPIPYKVGNNSLEIYYEGEKMLKNEHYVEVGETGTVSNVIQFFDWGQAVPVGRNIEFVVRGDYI